LKRLTLVFILILGSAKAQSPCDLCFETTPEKAMEFQWKSVVTSKNITLNHTINMSVTIDGRALRLESGTRLIGEDQIYTKSDQVNIPYGVSLNQEYYFRTDSTTARPYLVNRRWARLIAIPQSIVFEIGRPCRITNFSGQHYDLSLFRPGFYGLRPNMREANQAIGFYEIERPVSDHTLPTFDHNMGSIIDNYNIPKAGTLDTGTIVTSGNIYIGQRRYDLKAYGKKGLYDIFQSQSNSGLVDVEHVLGSDTWFNVLSHSPFNYYGHSGRSDQIVHYWANIDFSKLYLVTNGVTIAQFDLELNNQYDQINGHYFSKNLTHELEVILRLLNEVEKTMGENLYLKSYGRLEPIIASMRRRIYLRSHITSLDSQVTHQWHQSYFLAKNVLSLDFANDRQVDSRRYLVDQLESHLDYVNRIYQFNPGDPGGSLTSFLCRLLSDLLEELESIAKAQEQSYPDLLSVINDLYDKSYEISVRSSLGQAHIEVLNILDQLLNTYDLHRSQLIEFGLSVEDANILLVRIEKLIEIFHKKRNGN